MSYLQFKNCAYQSSHRVIPSECTAINYISLQRICRWGMYLIDRNIDNLIKLTKYFAMFNKCQGVIALIICRYRWAWEWYRWSIIWLHYLSWTLLTHSDTLGNGRCATRSQATLYTAGQLCTQPCYVNTHSSAHLPCYTAVLICPAEFWKWRLHYASLSVVFS